MSEEYAELAKKLSLGQGVKILKAHACGLIALEKPISILSHPNEPHERDRSLIRADYDFENRRFHNLSDPGSFEEVFLVHRLDSATSGVILVCTNAQMMPLIIRSFEKGRVSKSYQAIVNGRPRSPSVWNDKLTRREGGGRGVRMEDGGKILARTELKLLRGDANQLGLSLVQLWPITGRTHQLRYQCTRHGHPILGDASYGDFGLNRHYSKLPFARRLFLHSSMIELLLVHEGENVTFTAESPLPEEFERLISPNKETRAVTRYAVTSSYIANAQRKHFRKPSF